MKFDEATLMAIKLAGQSGQTIIDLSRELGVTPYEIDELRRTNKRFDEAMKIYEFNFRAYSLSTYQKQSFTGKNPVIAKELLDKLQDSDKSTDNEIIIKIVD